MSLFFTKFVKLDPDPQESAFRKTAESGSAKNECGSTALTASLVFLIVHVNFYAIELYFALLYGT